jgi:hypothetical protein
MKNKRVTRHKSIKLSQNNGLLHAATAHFPAPLFKDVKAKIKLKGCPFVPKMLNSGI